ncbi:MAG: Slp family lipoprotein [Wenzhouxiangella sp.]
MNSIFIRSIGLTIIAGAALFAAGCATVPAPLAGDFPEIQPDEATERTIGTRVRWGGSIVDTRPGAEETCIEVLARELGRGLRPLETDRTHGRFLACRDGFRDPEVFASGRELTVVGRLNGFVTGTIGEFEYEYPRVDAEAIYLWSPRAESIYYHPDPWWHTGWWPYYYHPHYRPVRTRISGGILITR